MRVLAPTHTCFAFDTPGFGDSDPVTIAGDGVAELVDAMAETVAVLRMPRCAVFGSHTGAAIALEFGRRHPERVTGLVLDGVPMYSAVEQTALFQGYFEPLDIDEHGGHFAHVWTRFRDLFQWFPWTHRDPQYLNSADVPTAERLQLWVTMFYRAAAHYIPAYRAAIAYGNTAQQAVADLHVPAVFMAQDTDMLFSHLDRLPPLAANQRIVRVRQGSKPQAILDAVTQFDTVAPAPCDVRSGGACESARQFIDLHHGQVQVRTIGAIDAPVLLYLHDVPGSSALIEPRLLQLAADFRIVSLDLPGSGESPPLAASAPLRRNGWACATPGSCRCSGRARLFRTANPRAGSSRRAMRS